MYPSTSVAKQKTSKYVIPCSQPCDHVLQGLRVFIQVHKDFDEAIKKLTKSLGAEICEELDENVTHFIYKNFPDKLYWKAKDLKVHLVSIRWLQVVYDTYSRPAEVKFPVLECSAKDILKICQNLCDYSVVFTMDNSFANTTELWNQTGLSTVYEVNLNNFSSSDDEFSSDLTTSKDFGKCADRITHRTALHTNLRTSKKKSVSSVSASEDFSSRLRYTNNETTEDEESSVGDMSLHISSDKSYRTSMSLKKGTNVLEMSMELTNLTNRSNDKNEKNDSDDFGLNEFCEDFVVKYSQSQTSCGFVGTEMESLRISNDESRNEEIVNIEENEEIGEIVENEENLIIRDSQLVEENENEGEIERSRCSRVQEIDETAILGTTPEEKSLTTTTTTTTTTMTQRRKKPKKSKHKKKSKTPLFNNEDLEDFKLEQTTNKQRTKKSNKSQKPLKKKYTAFSGLNREQIFKFKRMAKSLGGVKIQYKANSKTTHLVVGDALKTYNLLRSLINRSWILHTDWLSESFNSNRWMDEFTFEMCGFSPRYHHQTLTQNTSHNQSDKKVDIFKDAGSMYVSAQLEEKEDIEELIMLCNGTVTQSVNDADILVDELLGEYNSILNERQQICVSVDWVLDSISRYRCLKHRKYRLH